MDLDDLMQVYFGSTDVSTLEAATLERGRDRIAVAFGTERDPGRRFALWALLHALGDAPDPAIAFEDAAERKAAEDYAWAAERLGRR